MDSSIPVDFSLLNWSINSTVTRGLKNIQNTCFINSTLQCLLYTPPIQNIPHTCSKKYCTLSLLKELFTSDAKIPEKFHQFIYTKTKKFTIDQQEDAHETLRFLIEHIYPKTIGDFIFGGTLQSSVKCKKCSYESVVLEDFLDLSLEVTHFTLEDCLKNFCKRETLDGNNRCYCNGCKRSTDSYKQFLISATPVVLTFHLKRFGNNGIKDKSNMTFPEKLDLKQFTKLRRKEEYELYAVLVHTGRSCRAGHYYCYIKGPDSLWYLANDLIISKSDLKKVLNDRSAYIIFYKKIIEKGLPKKKRKYV
ncbi:hypothetical protein SteCoe_19206 [Stentor coeruleus]|uniref:USP domain-containing protein n=1 Tax=Stentor coeruleus TaxID=5963 RepID=A0A1R2BUS5_9CILI|nr:hypothetical protein SteCoe_19206 [Stentor coeruleus]